MKADLISLIHIMDEKDLAIGKSLIDEHDASSIKIEEVQFFIYYLEV
jgi:hypothetical protein